ncbi:MAG TPA: ABC transporter permease [Candidatus Saccharimonadales bacterium]
MIATLRAEFRKLLTVRSTYFLTGFAWLLVGFFSLYGVGYRAWEAGNASYLQTSLLQVMNPIQLFAAVVAILLITHEYRYNTIMYTLTISNSRLKVLLSKFLVVGVYGVVFTLLTLALAVLEMYIGVKLGGHHFGVQHVDLWSVVGRSLAFICGGAFVGMIFGFWSRSVVFAIVAYFILPSLEPLLHMWLKVSNNVLPFNALAQIITPMRDSGALSALAATGVFAAYLAVAWAASAVLFVRRDAN